MKAMILAAGRGERMRPLTDFVPKALLEVGGRALIEWHLLRLAACGVRDVVVNHAHLGPMIEARLGDGSRYGVRLIYSREPQALETAGAVALALSWLGEQPFLLVNADIYTDFDFAQLERESRDLPAGCDACLVLVDNPPHHPHGDFALVGGRVAAEGEPRLTYSGIGAYRPRFFADIAPGTKAPLGPRLRQAAAAGRVRGLHYHGRWIDVGTPERLEHARAMARAGEGR
ncbi:N-acetylmuramate alpha-1-phosphate uridylyltransferase MurU [Pelomicrobium methylotrophicum]|uniref:Nucleotidyltransferase family protein n=1 Tax=Pelomicrobium methylotrophicum TaxID=2602750 RepID=A0A5C7EI37_9PROT|nr:nucleotidyltransferase family protein [Pelomicrobium methylotrophicum]TXF11001.1 nucleotidyltransferase family protein [Pelomicrobium methylotrophicum]